MVVYFLIGMEVDDVDYSEGLNFKSSMRSSVFGGRKGSFKLCLRDDIDSRVTRLI